MTECSGQEPYPDWPVDQAVPGTAESPDGDVAIPGLPAGFLAYQITFRPVKGCPRCGE